jgi:hypothetical protein
MTAVRQLPQDIARHLDVQTTVMPQQRRDRMKKPDLRRLTNRVEELAEPATSTEANPTDGRADPSMRRRHDVLAARDQQRCSAQHLQFSIVCSRRCPSHGLNSHVVRGARSSMTMSSV